MKQWEREALDAEPDPSWPLETRIAFYREKVLFACELGRREEEGRLRHGLIAFAMVILALAAALIWAGITG